MKLKLKEMKGPAQDYSNYVEEIQLKKKDLTSQIVIFTTVSFSFSMCESAIKYLEMVKKISTCCWLMKKFLCQIPQFLFQGQL